ncbi:hypothetical protein PI124_g2177 [Phytophthora idaei]|nr:hypothetical protein PI125_g1820 [Phytophthora idaei]KAG3172497.1 hypothetical protein PI126_g1341 [Phytophthora idaei]KAG3253271.1 hypothetical protein PI124_g2177 [Phytophthora idaei]
MAGGGKPTDSGSSGDVHASGLAILAESSVARTMNSEEMTAHRDAEQEQVRVKLEKARTRMGSSLAAIPTGREYDSRPDALDEPVYDALEKAYNAAFLVHPPAEAGHVHKEEPMVRHEEKLGAEDGGKVTGPGLKESKDGNEDEQTSQVGTLKSMCLSTLQQHADSNEQGEVNDGQLKKNIDSASEARRTVSSTGPGSEGAHSAGDVGGRSEAPASLSADSAMSTASPPQSPMSALNRTSSEDGFLSTPEPKRKPHHMTMKADAGKNRVGRADHLSLNEFLVSELEVYCSQLLERGLPKRGSSGASDLARITGLQLFQDHQRALMDFDDEWTRSHNDSFRLAPTTSDELPRVSSTISANPFQQGIANPIGVDEWATLLTQVRASSTKSTPAGTCYTPEMIIGGGSGDLFASYKRGSNGFIVGEDSCHNERLQVSAFMAQIASSQHTSAFYVVVAAGSDLARWEKALSSEQLIQLYPYWGSKQDRQNLLQLLSNEYFSTRNVSAHVLLTSYEVFMEDISIVASLQCQLSVIDIPRQATDQIAAIWPHLLSLRCRQRLLLCQPSFNVGARKLVHFLVPELFSSRRKLLAWNSAAFHTHQIRAVCNVVKTFMLDSNEEACTAFMTKVESCTKQNSEIEMAALDTLNKQGIVRAIEPSIMVPVNRVVNRKSRSRPSGHVPAKGKLEPQDTAMDPVDSQLTIKAPNALKKRRGNDGTPGSRQRIGRCGKCSGCLAEDCMKCGHCQDMKKYGGPGLRKQSCKDRKCLNPKIWGYATRKRKRSKTKRAGPGDTNSVKGDMEVDDDGSVAYSSVESDGESVSTATYGNGDSDDESLRYSDATMDSPRDLLLPASDTSLDDHLSLSDLSSRSASTKSRLVRCGECEGCNAPDCMKCPHCLDMKKYGGPGLRKQTCKTRKCNAPKILMLNKAKGGHDQYVDEKGNVVYSGLNDSTFPGFYEAPDRAESASPSAKSESGVLTVMQECERYVKPRLVFACVDCAARFSSSRVLNFHTRVEHATSTNQGTLSTLWEREASRMFLRPFYQNAMISAQFKQQDRSSPSSPLGYAKLEGQSFQYFFVEPLVVLGRMESRWCNLYKDMGFGNLKGLPGGTVDCHIGNDSMIATRHAVISWDARTSSFVIECLSLRTPISVNGREISFSSPPAALSSRNLIQIGASVFYFLLPKASKASLTSKGIEGGSTPRA